MSSIIVITPLIIANWSVITAAVTAAVASTGFSLVTAAASGAHLPEKVDRKARAEIEVDDSEILQEAASVGGELVIEREDVRIVFTRDVRGALRMCVEGERHTKAELRRIGEEILGRVTQQYVYHRVVTALAERRMAVVDEHVDADRTVRLRVRNV